MKKRLLHQLVWAVLFLPCQGFSASVCLIGPNTASVAEARKNLVKAGISPSLFIQKIEENTIVIALPSALNQAIQRLKAKDHSNAWLILQEGPQGEALAINALHERIPQSRISSLAESNSVGQKIEAILREQRRLKAGISGLNTSLPPVESDLAPLGSAIMTTSGKLAMTGIQAIIHTASGAMMSGGPGFDPTVESVQNSVLNAVALARENGHRRLALPIIAGSIFRHRLNNGAGITLDELVDHIVDILVQESAGMTFILTVRENNPEEGVSIRKSLVRLKPSDRARFEVADQVPWALVKFKAHHASAIINSANMEVLFGGGVSGIVADAANGIIPADQPAGPSLSFDYPSEEENWPSFAIDAEAAQKIWLFRSL